MKFCKDCKHVTNVTGDGGPSPDNYESVAALAEDGEG